MYVGARVSGHDRDRGHGHGHGRVSDYARGCEILKPS
jgi:hypothetical protein